MSSTYEPKEAGIIVGEASSNEFFFASKTEEYPPKWEYVVVYSREDQGGGLVEIPVVAQVESVISASQALSREVDLEALKRIIAAELEDVRTWGRARILGYLSEDESRILQPRRAVTPGKSIFIAPGDILSKFYSFPFAEGLHIGSLITRSDVPVYLSLRGFRRHVAIIAQTGAGKSYCGGVLIEELMRKNATVIVIDPHADYVFLSLTRDEKKHEFSEMVAIFQNPASTSRFGGRMIGRIEPYEVSFADLDHEEICEIAGVGEKAANIREAVRKALESLKDRQYTPKDLLNSLMEAKWAEKNDKGEPDRTWKAHAASAAKYIRSIVNLNVFGKSSTRIQKLLKPGHVSIVDLSGLEDRAMNYIASKILQEVYDSVSSESYEYPVFIVVEEAHRFIPSNRETYASRIINKIAAEGRKFGVFLTLITQRPFKVDPDSLSQCNSQIVMRLTNPLDQQAVEQSSERMSKDLMADLPGLNPGECVIVGEVTRAPVMVKVRLRETKEGGADVDVVRKLRESREAKKGERMDEDERSRRIPFKGEFK